MVQSQKSEGKLANDGESDADAGDGRRATIYQTRDGDGIDEPTNRR
jgi:hypothetical protein